MNRMKELREQLGYRQKDFAELLGIKPTTYNGYECGTHAPSLDILVQIARKCGVTVDYLLGLTEDAGTDPGEKIPPAPAGVGDRREHIRAFVQELVKLLGLEDADGELSDEDLAFFLGIYASVKAYLQKRGEPKQ